MDEHQQYPVLSAVRISALFDQHDLELPLFSLKNDADGDRIRILFDDNGRGKTTLLRGIHHLMSWQDLETHLAALAELPLDGLALDFGTVGTIAFERNPSDPAVCQVSVDRRRRGKAQLEYDAGRFDPRKRRRIVAGPPDLVTSYREHVSSLCLPPILVADDRSVRSDDLTEYAFRRRVALNDPSVPPHLREATRRVDPSAELASLLEELGTEFRRETFGRRRIGGEAVYADVVRRIVADDTRQARGDVEALRQRASQVRDELELPSKYNLIEVSQLEEVIETLGGLRRNSRNKKTIETVLDPFFTNLEAEIERLQPGVERIDRFVSTVNGFLSEKEMSFTLSDGLVVISEGGAGEVTLDPDQLSSGERHLLLLLGSAMLSRNDRLILIDEPELSLGISWKRKLLKSLLFLTIESRARFLVASHSVEIITPYRDTAMRLRSIPDSN